jgi:hypothetical protein
MRLSSNFAIVLLLLLESLCFVSAFPITHVGKPQKSSFLYNSNILIRNALTLSATKEGEGGASIPNNKSDDATMKKCQIVMPNRRKFVSTASTAVFHAFVLGSFVVPLPSQAQQGYLPDMKGGFVKPRGLGGLPKKIRAVGIIMVSFVVLRGSSIMNWLNEFQEVFECICICLFTHVDRYTSNWYPSICNFELFILQKFKRVHVLGIVLYFVIISR